MNRAFSYILFAALFLFVSYFIIRNYRISKYMWKNCGDSSNFSDVLQFDFSWNIFDNALYQNGNQTFTMIEYQYIFLSDTMIIQSVEDKKPGRYCGK